MTYSQAKSVVGCYVRLSLESHRGEQTERVHVFNIGMAPRLGPCLFTDKGEIRLDRVLRYETFRKQAA